jgi:hypothetical protein
VLAWLPGGSALGRRLLMAAVVAIAIGALGLWLTMR